VLPGVVLNDPFCLNDLNFTTKNLKSSLLGTQRTFVPAPELHR